jgi:plastocyanin
MRRMTVGALAAALVALAIGGQASAGDGSAKRAKKVTADNYDFSPKSVSVSPGSKVKWTATQGSHTVTFKGGFDEIISPNGTATTSRKFKKPGTYKYVCTFHRAQKMKGKVVVG